MFSVERGLFDHDVLPVYVEFLADDHGERSLDALAHLRVLTEEGDATRWGDAEKGIGLECSGLGGGGGRGGQPAESEQQATTGSGGEF